MTAEHKQRIQLLINSFDIDGVIFMRPGINGVYPGKADVIITGRSMEEVVETNKMLASKGILNEVYYNPILFKDKTRESSGEHKAAIIKRLFAEGVKVVCHFEDDEIQANIIRQLCPNVNVVHLVHDLVEKENVRHLEF